MDSTSARIIKIVIVSIYLIQPTLGIHVWADNLGLHCYPNPAKLDGKRLTIAFNISTDSTVTLEIYTIEGYKVKTILNNVSLDATKVKRTLWGYKDEAGETVNPGVYVAVLHISNSNGGRKTDRFVFILE